MGMRKSWPLHLMVLPTLVIVLIFQYTPMPGVIMAFMDYKPWLGFDGSPWIGWQNFRDLFAYPDAVQVIWNTLIIAVLKIVFNLITPFVFALLLNEVRFILFKRFVQTFVYLPHFLSWVILGGILLDILSPDGGAVNRVLAGVFGLDPVFFLGKGDWFRFTVIVSEVWKEFGFGTIIFLAALAGVNPELYEAALIDGASRWKQALYITIPSILPISIVLLTLSLGNVLNAGFDQILNLYNPLVYDKGDIIDSYVYRVGLIGGEFGFGTAVGLFKSVIGMLLIVFSYWAANRFANYRIF